MKKKIFSICSYLFAFGIMVSLPFLNGCTVNDSTPGPQGLQGPQGPQGPAGESGFVFEYEGINFTAPEYSALLEYPNDFEGLDSDVALVYLLWGSEVENGQEVEIWRQLPQTVFTENGLLQYNFDFSKNSSLIFLNAEFPLDLLTAIDTDDWVARVVVIPGDFWNSGRVANMEYFELLEALGLEHKPAKTVINRK